MTFQHHTSLPLKVPLYIPSTTLAIVRMYHFPGNGVGTNPTPRDGARQHELQAVRDP